MAYGESTRACTVLTTAESYAPCLAEKIKRSSQACQKQEKDFEKLQVVLNLQPQCGTLSREEKVGEIVLPSEAILEWELKTLADNDNGVNCVKCFF